MGDGRFGPLPLHEGRLVGEGRFQTCPYRFRWWAKGDGSPHVTWVARTLGGAGGSGTAPTGMA